MKPSSRVVFLVSVSCVLAVRLTAQGFSTLHSFEIESQSAPYSNAGGNEPYGGMTWFSNTLYGTASFGGNFGNGTVFRMNTDGSGFAPLHSFSGVITNSTNSDGALLNPGLLVSGSTLYGTTILGGVYGWGTVFAVDTNGSDFRVLHAFSKPNVPFGNSDGANPFGGLVLSGNTLYGTTETGGLGQKGTVFALQVDGTGFRTINAFSGGVNGASPGGGLVLTGNELCGVTFEGGDFDSGIIFAVRTDGTNFRKLHSFGNNNQDGTAPLGTLALEGATLYGTTIDGGSATNGTVFKVNVDGTGFATLHSFAPAGLNSSQAFINADGLAPNGSLNVSGGVVYGTAARGGEGGNGTVFQINGDGSDFITLHTFTAGSGLYHGGITNNDGAGPRGGMVLSGSQLYGATFSGGADARGTVFSIQLPIRVPQLTITASATNIILAWPTNVSGLFLQLTTNLSGPVWTAVSATPSVWNGYNILTNPISHTAHFYRLAP